MANAKFKITGDLSVNRGYDASHSEVLQLQLEDQPSLDVYKTQYTIGRATAGAPTPTFSTSLGIASPANGIVELTMPASGVHTYEVICEVNNGVDSAGVVQPSYVFSRLVAIRSTNGFRKILAAETTEYDPSEGWAGAVNEIAENAGAGGGGGTVTSVSGAAPITITGTSTDPIVGFSNELSTAADPNTLALRDNSGGTSFTVVTADTVRSNGNLQLSADGFGVITLDGAGTGDLLVPMQIQGGAYKLYAQADLVRSIPMHWRSQIVAGAPGWIPTTENRARQAVDDSEALWYCDFALPQGAVMSSVGFYVRANGTGANPNPEFPPTFYVVAQNLSTGVQNFLATQLDPAPGTYRTATRWVDVMVSGGSHTIDNGAYRYFVIVSPEEGTNALTGYEIRAMRATYSLPAGFSIGLN